MSDFSKRIKSLRKDNEMTQDDLAKLLGVTRQNVSLYEKGEVLPPVDKISIMADYFKCSLGYILGEKSKDESKSEDICEELRELARKLLNSELTFTAGEIELSKEKRSRLSSMLSNLADIACEK